MYTVVRFTLDRARAQQLVPLGEKMNEADPGVFDGLRAKQDGFACEVERSDLWGDHYRAIRAFISLHRDRVRDAIALGADVTFDVAIDQEDRAARMALVLRCPPDLLADLSSCGASFELSIYSGGDEPRSLEQPRLDQIFFASYDPMALAGFYRDIVGLPLQELHVESEPTRWGCDVGSIYVSIHDQADLPEMAGFIKPGAINLFWKTETLDAILDRARVAGVSTEDYFEYPDCRVLRLRDPDGNLVRLEQPARSA